MMALLGNLYTPKLTARSVNAGATSPNAATATIEFNTSGNLNTIVDTGSGGLVTGRLPDWLGLAHTIVGAGTNLEIRLTVNSGNSPSGGSSAINTWLPLTSARTWFLFKNSLGALSGDWLVEIRASTGQVLASAVFSMFASQSSP